MQTSQKCHKKTCHDKIRLLKKQSRVMHSYTVPSNDINAYKNCVTLFVNPVINLLTQIRKSNDLHQGIWKKRLKKGKSAENLIITIVAMTSNSSFKITFKMLASEVGLLFTKS